MDLLVSTRGSGLLGDFYTRKDIQVVRKRSAFRKRRAKGGKIVYPKVKGKSVRQQYLQQLEDPQIGAVIAGQQVATAPPPIILGGESGFDRRQIESNLKRMLAEKQVLDDAARLRQDIQRERSLAAMEARLSSTFTGAVSEEKIKFEGSGARGTGVGITTTPREDIKKVAHTLFGTPRDQPTLAETQVASFETERVKLGDPSLEGLEPSAEDPAVSIFKKVKARRASVAPLDISEGLAAGSIHLNPMNRGLVGDDT